MRTKRAGAQPARNRAASRGRAFGGRQRATVSNRVRVNAQLIDARMMRISGRKLTIAISRMSLPSRARSPKPSPISCRPNFAGGEECDRERPTKTSLPLNSTAGQKIYLKTGFSAIGAKCAQGIDLLNQALSRDPLSSPRSASSSTRMITFTRWTAIIHLSALRWPKVRFKRRSGCVPMQEKFISPRQSSLQCVSRL